MAIINKGKSFNNGEQLTAEKLNQVIDNATFTTSAVDNVSTQLAGEAIIVKDGGVTTAKLNDSAVTTAKIADANVTTAKIADANVTFAKLTDVIDDDTMATASDTTLATSESIKAYVDASAQTFTPSTYAGGESVTLPNGLIMKFGIATGPTSQTAITITFADAFPNGIISAQATATNTSAGTGATYDYWYQIVNQSLNTSVSIMPQGASAEPPAHNVNWMVIGY